MSSASDVLVCARPGTPLTIIETTNCSPAAVVRKSCCPLAEAGGVPYKLLEVA